MIHMQLNNMQELFPYNSYILVTCKTSNISDVHIAQDLNIQSLEFE